MCLGLSFFSHVHPDNPWSSSCDFSGDNPCLNGGACTDGIGRPICTCATGFCGPTCADPLDVSQNGGQCCVDDPDWSAMSSGGQEGGPPCSFFVGHESFCSDDRAVNAAGVTALEACPVSCGSGCLLTHDDCCELSHQSSSRYRIGTLYRYNSCCHHHQPLLPPAYLPPNIHVFVAAAQGTSPAQAVRPAPTASARSHARTRTTRSLWSGSGQSAVPIATVPPSEKRALERFRSKVGPWLLLHGLRKARSRPRSPKELGRIRSHLTSSAASSGSTVVSLRREFSCLQVRTNSCGILMSSECGTGSVDALLSSNQPPATYVPQRPVENTC
jgi:hypothetical protein